MISFSAGLISESSMLSPFISPLADSRTRTSPPPDTPSTSMCSSSACIASIFDLGSDACFISPRKSVISLSPAGCVQFCSNQVCSNQVCANQVCSSQVRSSVVVFLNGHFRSQRTNVEFVRRSPPALLRLRSVGLLRHDSLGLAHVHDFRTGKPGQHGLHQGVGAHARLKFGLSCVLLRLDRWVIFLRRHDDVPRTAGTLRKLACELIDQSAGGSLFQADLKPTVIATHQPHVPFEGELDCKIPVRSCKRNEILKAPDDDRRAFLLRSGCKRRRDGSRSGLTGRGHRRAYPPFVWSGGRTGDRLSGCRWGGGCRRVGLRATIRLFAVQCTNDFIRRR